MSRRSLFGVAVGTACTICGEVASAMAEAASRANLYIKVDTGADQPHENHREPKGPESTIALIIRGGNINRRIHGDSEHPIINRVVANVVLASAAISTARS